MNWKSGQNDEKNMEFIRIEKSLPIFAIPPPLLKEKLDFTPKGTL